MIPLLFLSSPVTLTLFLCHYPTSANIIEQHLRRTLASEDGLTPPIARREENRLVYAGIAPPGWDPSLPRQAVNSTNPLMDPPVPIPDPYGWLRDDKRSSEEVLDYLEAENEYTHSYTDRLKGLQNKLYGEFLSSLEETDYSTPRPKGDWVYYTRTSEGSSYPMYCRAPRADDYIEKSNDWDGSKDSPILPGEEVYLDVNELAINQTYCKVGTIATSPSQELVAYAVDYSGSEKYELHIRDFNSGDDVGLKKTAEDTNGDLLEISNVVWGEDNATIYYTTMDQAQRSYRLYRRELKSENDFIDKLLKEESDALFVSSVAKSFDEKYLFYRTASIETSEVWYIDLSAVEDLEEIKCVSTRRNKVLYDVESHDGSWYIVTNVDSSKNMKLMTSQIKSNSDANWKLVEDGDGNPIFNGSLAKSLDSITAFKTHAVLEGREDGIPRIWTFSFGTKALTRLEFDDAAYDVALATNYEVNADKIAVKYSSMLTPPSSIEISLDDDSQRSVLKTQAVPGYAKDLYGSDRLRVLSRDGKTEIPISVVYRKDTMEKAESGHPVPTHLYGYGSYGSTIEAKFGSSRLPLLNRGMIYVIAHVRGGGEFGRPWYEEPDGGKLLCKKNTFNDFVDVARFLAGNWTTPEMLSCEGRSTGGLLVGVSINQAPDLFRVAILGVPFVDVAVTMTDASIPLTSEEWVEWGNPNEEKVRSITKSIQMKISIPWFCTFICWHCSCTSFFDVSHTF